MFRVGQEAAAAGGKPWCVVPICRMKCSALFELPCLTWRRAQASQHRGQEVAGSQRGGGAARRAHGGDGRAEQAAGDSRRSAPERGEGLADAVQQEAEEAVVPPLRRRRLRHRRNLGQRADLTLRLQCLRLRQHLLGPHAALALLPQRAGQLLLRWRGLEMGCLVSI